MRNDIIFFVQNLSYDYYLLSNNFPGIFPLHNAKNNALVATGSQMVKVHVPVTVPNGIEWK